jgi:hypothetical protein
VCREWRTTQGFAKEIFTDAGKYVLHFGSRMADAQHGAPQLAAAPHAEHQQPALAGGASSTTTTTATTTTTTTTTTTSSAPAAISSGSSSGGPPVTSLAVARTSVTTIPTVSGNQLVRARVRVLGSLNSRGPAPCA